FHFALESRPGDADIRRMALTLPDTELLDSRRIGEICGQEEFSARRCPVGSVRGQAKVWTPVLDHPLRGPIYLRASGNRLPEIAVSLHGQVDLNLTGRIDSVGGRLRTTFRALPDLPLSRVAFTLH